MNEMSPCINRNAKPNNKQVPLTRDVPIQPYVDTDLCLTQAGQNMLCFLKIVFKKLFLKHFLKLFCENFADLLI